MDITLMDFSVGVMSLGIRTLTSYLKQHGHHVRMIFLPGDVEEMHLGRNYVYKVPPEVIDGIAEVCSRSQLVGLSLMSNYFDQACQITQELSQRVDVPVIWGGIHATVKPEECLEHADMVCIGEGEEALLELADRMDAGQDVTHVANIWSKRNGEVVRNAARPAIHDLDSIPPARLQLRGPLRLRPQDGTHRAPHARQCAGLPGPGRFPAGRRAVLVLHDDVPRVPLRLLVLLQQRVRQDVSQLAPHPQAQRRPRDRGAAARHHQDTRGALRPLLRRRVLRRVSRAHP